MGGGEGGIMCHDWKLFTLYFLTLHRRKMGLIEGNPMSSSKKIPVKELCGRCLSVWGPETHSPLPLHTVYVYTVYLVTHRKEVEGGRMEPERRLEGQQFTKLGRKYKNDWLCLPSINSDKLLQQSHLTGLYFKMTKFCFGVYIVKWSCPACVSPFFSHED